MSIKKEAADNGNDNAQKLQELSDAFRNDLANQGGNNATQLADKFIADVQALVAESESSKAKK